jgi:hypothetical protein
MMPAVSSESATVSGARTAFFAPEVDRFMLAVRAAGSKPAAIWLSGRRHDKESGRPGPNGDGSFAR